MVITVVLSVVLLLLCAALIFLVVSQDTKGGGLAGALGGGVTQTAFGGRSAESITKLTAWLAVVFFIVVLAMGLIKPSDELGVMPENEPPAPVAPAPTE